MRLSFGAMIMIIILFELCGCEPILRYFLYVGGAKVWAELPSDGIIAEPMWCFEKKVKVLIHGYNSNETAANFGIFDSQFMTILAKEYEKYDSTLNIIAVDWKSLATFPRHQYFYAVRNVKTTGALIADYLVQLLENGEIKELESIHILGSSMGAHVAGATGYEIQRIMGSEKVSRTTGLDPASPGFTTWNDKWPDDMNEVLDSSDAEFVDIIHTNMGRGIMEPILSGALGTNLQTGNVDFYPNGGEVQKQQCTNWKDQFDTCSHKMSVLFYAQTPRQPFTYTACPCDNYELFLIGRCNCTYKETGQLLGDLTKSVAHGSYFMTINDLLSRETFVE